VVGNKHFVYILYSKELVSLFTTIKNWFEGEHIDKHKKGGLITAIFQGEAARQGMPNECRITMLERLKIDIPEDLMWLILLWNEKGSGREALIKRAKKDWERE